MSVVFTGVGEAFDELTPNTSILVESDQGSILLDCGFTAASQFWKHAAAPLDLDAIFLSHFHGDHYFGLPALLVRSIEEGRTRELCVIAQPGGANLVRAAMEMAYPGTLSKAAFALRFTEALPDKTVHEAGFDLSFAMGGHSVPCLAVRVDSGQGAMFYSGDGSPTPDTAKLAVGADLAVHEAFSLAPDTPGHGTVDGAIRFAREAGCRNLALVHIRRDIRRERLDEIKARAASADGLRVFAPEPGDTFFFTPDTD